MEHRILLIFLLSYSIVGFGQSDTIIYKNEASKKIRMVIMGDSLWLQNYESKKSLMTYLDYEAMEVEGFAFYTGKLKANDSEFDVTVQFLEDSLCTIDSEISEFNFGLSKEEVKPKYKNNPFGSEGSTVNRGFRTGSEKQYGNDEGSGNGPSGPDRKRLTKVDLSKVKVSESASLIFKVNIDKEGNVVSAYYLPSGMTTVDNSVLEEVRKVLVEQLKYEKSKTISSDRITVELRKR